MTKKRIGSALAAVALLAALGAGGGGTQVAYGQSDKNWETNSLGMEFVWIPAGTFQMGSPAGEVGRIGDERQHEVTIRRGFWMGKHEVTQGQWEAVMGKNPSKFQKCGSRCPVESVSWTDVQEFIGRLNVVESTAMIRIEYRLPTEAEWEYAARAGTVGTRYGELDEIAWYRGNSGGSPHPVGEKRPNGWGLHDMLGNVYEWVGDWRGGYPAGSATDPAGPSRGTTRVFRGGGWISYAWNVRSASRRSVAPGYRYTYFGFRLVRTD